ncbi:MAG TPA: transglutaminase-like domain-containing protein [Alphaproteobacteria bacterium]
MDISGWTDNGAIEAWLLEQSRRPDDALDLAQMALALAALGRPGSEAAPYAAHLDALAREAEAVAEPGMAPAEQVAALNAVLFDRGGYRGDSKTYDDLANADLMRVIDRKKGLPIALSILYLHMARFLRWPAGGVNFPGHFLVQVGAGEEGLLVDPFERGAVRAPAELDRLVKRMQGPEAALAPEHLVLAENREILLRLENNIKVRCLKAGDVAGGLGVVERMVLVTPAHPGLWYEAAALNAELGQLRRARTCLEAVMRLDPERRLAPQVEELMRRLKSRLN